MNKEFYPKALRAEYFAPKIPGEDKLLIVLHGLGDSSRGFRFLPQLLAIPGLHCLLLDAPDTYFTGYSWFEFDGDAQTGILRSRELLFSVLQEAEQNGWQSGQIGVVGFSQGCLMALDLVARYPKRLGPVVGISGYVAFLEEYPEKFSAVIHSQNVFVTHGTADPILPLANTEPQMLALKGMGMPLKWKVYEKDHTIDPDLEVSDIRSFLVKGFAKQ